MDAGHRNNIGADGGQGQLRREEKEHKPMLSKVKEKVGKIKHTIAGGRSQAGRGHGKEEEAKASVEEPVPQAHGEDKRIAVEPVPEAHGKDKPVAREPVAEVHGEDKPVAMEPDPEVHGAPMYESERAPAVQDLVAKYDQRAREPQGAAHGGHAVVPDSAAQETRQRDDSEKVRLGDLGGPVVEDPAAPRSTTPAAREGEDIGTTPVVKEFESMTLSDDVAHVGAAKQGARAEDGKDATYTDKLKNVAAVPAGYGSKLASTAHKKVVGGGTVEDTGKRDEEERAEPVPVPDAGGGGEAGVDTDTDKMGGTTYTDKLKNVAAVPAGYGTKLATTAREKVIGGAAAEDTGKRNDEERAEPVPVSDAGATEEARPVSEDVGTEERKESEASDNMGAATYTDRLKNVATVPTEYGTKLVSTVRQKVMGGGTAEDTGKRDEERAEPEPVSDVGAAEEARPLSDIGTAERKESEATDKQTGAATYTDKIKNVATVPTEYGTKLVSTVRQKVTGGTAGGSEKRDDERAEALPESDASAGGKPGVDTATNRSTDEARPLSDAGTDEKNESEATDKIGGATYTDKLKNVAAVPTEYGTKLVSTVREKVTGGGTAAGSDAGDGGETGVDTATNRSSTPDVGAEERNEAATTDSASGPGYTEKVKSATAGTTEYGKQLASTAYEKAAGISSAVVGKVQQDTSKEEAGPGTVGQRVPAPSQVITKARAVTSLTGGSRVSDTEQPNAATGADMEENGAANAPMLSGEETSERKLNTNTM